MVYGQYPVSYPLYGNQSSTTPQTQAPIQQQNSIIWVQGMAGAKSYLVAPNNTVQLWDSEAQTIYLKSADSSGMPSMKILDYTIRKEETISNPIQAPENNVPSVDYATKNDLKALKGEILKIIKEKNKE